MFISCVCVCLHYIFAFSSYQMKLKKSWNGSSLATNYANPPDLWITYNLSEFDYTQRVSDFECSSLSFLRGRPVKGRRRMCNMSGGSGPGRHHRSPALPLHLSQRVKLFVCVCVSDVSLFSLILTLLSFSCIDEWFEVNRSCPEHPSD